MGDLIDRQAALDAIKAWCADYPLELQEPIDDCWNSVRELPAVQPDHTADVSKKASISCGHENDLIFRQAAIDALARMMPRSYTPDGSHPADEEIFRAQEVFVDCIEALEILPPAQPEIIRRKDCKHYLHDEEYGFDWCNRMSGVFRAKPDGFCSWAVMRGGDSE